MTSAPPLADGPATSADAATPPTDAAIAVTDLHKTFGRGAKQTRALQGVTLAVRRGEIYGLLGRNGAGKTTMVKILLDLVRATSGRAAILGVPSTQRRARDPIGYLPEDHRFPEYQTAESALRFYGALSGLRGGALADRADEMLELVGLVHARKKKVRGYSKGMKQRLGLAAAMLSDPQVLFLDEPTDGVDAEGRRDIRELLERLRAEGRTIFLNSHLLGEIELLCDRVGMINRGRVIAEGTVDEVTALDRKAGSIEVDLGIAQTLENGVLVELQAHVHEVRRTSEKECVLVLEDHDAIDAVVDLLRARRLGIRRLVSTRRTLEDAFIARLHSDDAEAKR